MRGSSGLLLVASTTAACALVGPAVPVVITPGGAPGPQASVRDVFADLRSPAPTPAASPTATPRLLRTDRPLDVAIAGPGYLVAASRPDPRDWADVVLLRGGELRLEFSSAASPLPGSPGFPVSGPGEWSLRTPDGRWVLGFELSADPDRLPPAEARSSAFTLAFALGGGSGARAEAGALRLASASTLVPELRLDFRGRLTLAGGTPPTDAEGRARWLYLAVLQVEQPAKLPADPSGARRYDLDAGPAEVGIAALTDRQDGRRPVGMANALRPGWLEDAP